MEPFRYAWHGLMAGVGVLFVVLGALKATGNPVADDEVFERGIAGICATAYLLARAVEEAGERRARDTFDVLLPIGIYAPGILCIVIAVATA